jgi:hypothetical protein
MDGDSSISILRRGTRHATSEKVAMVVSLVDVPTFALASSACKRRRPQTHTHRQAHVHHFRYEHVGESTPLAPR